jgi:8-oxo-dGTP diphosphatase
MSSKKSSRPIVGVGVLVWRDKQLLLGKRVSEGRDVCWQFPGGHLENDETVTKCAEREVLEETGLKIKALRHLSFTDKTFLVGSQQYITLFISCDYESGEAQVLEPDKCKVWQWFDYRHLPAPLFQPIEILIAQQSESYQEDIHAAHRVAQVLLST